MNGMIERVARAIAKRHAEIMLGADPATQTADERELARVAIEAMRELPNAVHRAMCDAYGTPAAMWNAAIDEALK